MKAYELRTISDKDLVRSYLARTDAKRFADIFDISEQAARTMRKRAGVPVKSGGRTDERAAKAEQEAIKIRGELEERGVPPRFLNHRPRHWHGYLHPSVAVAWKPPKRRKGA